MKRIPTKKPSKEFYLIAVSLGAFDLAFGEPWMIVVGLVALIIIGISYQTTE